MYEKKQKRTRIIVAVSLIAVLIAGIAGLLYYNSGKPVDRAQKIVSEMDTEEKIGQILMLTFREWKSDASSESTQNVTALNDDLRTVISDYHLGGLALFAENCADAGQIVRLTYDMQHSSIDNGGLPLLICADQEGGNVTRAKFGTAFSGNMALGSSGNTENAYTAGQIIGKELVALGINGNFGPVADVNSNEKNPVIGVRSFSGDTDVVSAMATAMASGLESSGATSCAKHFPGHGDTATDSHSNLPLVEKSYEEWISSDGAPFAAMIEAKSTGMIMTAHIQYPGLDDTKMRSKSGEEITVPATMSKTILTDILKERLGFDGVVISDAMDMDAIDEQFEVAEAVVASIEAGTDIILMPVSICCPDDIAQLDALYQDIKAALADGRLSEERLTDAAVRVVRFKIEKGILEKNYDFDLDEAASYAEKLVGCKEHRDTERKIASECVNIRYDGDFDAFTPSVTDKIVCVMPREGEMFSAEHAFQRMKAEGTIPDTETQCYSYEAAWSDGAALDKELTEAVAEADYLILGFFQTSDTLGDPEHSRNAVFDEIVRYAKTDKIAIIWEYLPYGTEKYSSDYPCFVIYNSVGMTEKDIGAELYTDKYGPAIPAAMEMIFAAAK